MKHLGNKNLELGVCNDDDSNNTTLDQPSLVTTLCLSLITFPPIKALSLDIFGVYIYVTEVILKVNYYKIKENQINP